MFNNNLRYKSEKVLILFIPDFLFLYTKMTNEILFTLKGYALLTRYEGKEVIRRSRKLKF